MHHILSQYTTGRHSASLNGKTIWLLFSLELKNKGNLAQYSCYMTHLFSTPKGSIMPQGSITDQRESSSPHKSEGQVHPLHDRSQWQAWIQCVSQRLMCWSRGPQWSHLWEVGLPEGGEITGGTVSRKDWYFKRVLTKVGYQATPPHALVTFCKQFLPYCDPAKGTLPTRVQQTWPSGFELSPSKTMSRISGGGSVG